MKLAQVNIITFAFLSINLQNLAMQTAKEQSLEAFMTQEQRKDTFINQKFMVYLRTVSNKTAHDLSFFSIIDEFEIEAGAKKDLAMPLRLYGNAGMWLKAYSIGRKLQSNGRLNLEISYWPSHKILLAGLLGYGYPINQFKKHETASLGPYFDMYLDANIDLTIEGVNLEQSTHSITIEEPNPEINQLLALAKQHYITTNECMELPAALALRSRMEIQAMVRNIY